MRRSMILFMAGMFFAMFSFPVTGWADEASTAAPQLCVETGKCHQKSIPGKKAHSKAGKKKKAPAKKQNECHKSTPDTAVPAK